MVVVVRMVGMGGQLVVGCVWGMNFKLLVVTVMSVRTKPGWSSTTLVASAMSTLTLYGESIVWWVI